MGNVVELVVTMKQIGLLADSGYFENIGVGICVDLLLEAPYDMWS